MVILIADDDRLSRFTMKSMLSEILDEEYIFLEASDGKSMVEVCRKYLPDVVFADIKMPCMDGISAIEECQKYSRNTEFIVISGYSEFTYAKRCISLGITEYLLKPVEEEQLKQLMEKVCLKSKMAEKELNARFQLKVFEVFNYFITLGVEEKYEEFEHDPGWRYGMVGILTDVLLEGEESYMQAQKELIRDFQNFAEQDLKKNAYYTSLYSEEGTLYFCFCVSRTGWEKVEVYIKRMLYRKKEMSVQAVMFDAENLRELYRKSKKIDGSRSVALNYPSNRVLYERDFEFPSEQKRILADIWKMMNAWICLDKIVYAECLKKLEGYAEDGINIRNVSRFCSRIMKKNLETNGFGELLEHLKEMKGIMYSGRGKDFGVVYQVKEFIEKNYMKDISISQIAEELQMAPSYLSMLFHQEAGEKFIDYLTYVRMENAKRLLIQNSTAAIKDIAMMCGYNSSQYFAKVFLSQCGCSPSIFKKKNRLPHTYKET